MKRLAIIGLGLMGASLGLAAKKKKIARVVSGYARREETRCEALKRRVVDCVYDNPGEAVKGADMVVFCLPVLAIPEVAAQCIPYLEENCVVTDVGSTKVEIVSQMEKLMGKSKAIFVGSHPIAGAAESGLSAARENLYEGAAVVVTPAGRKIEKHVVFVRRMWEGIGGRVFIMNPKDHDRTIAMTSHLPHLVAAMLVNAVRRDGGKSWRFCGTGFKDTTRIAAGSEDIWHDILKSNRKFILSELKDFGKSLGKVSAMISKNDFSGLKSFLAANREERQKFEEQFNRERRP